MDQARVKFHLDLVRASMRAVAQVVQDLVKFQAVQAKFQVVQVPVKFQLVLVRASMKAVAQVVQAPVKFHLDLVRASMRAVAQVVLAPVKFHLNLVQATMKAVETHLFHSAVQVLVAAQVKATQGEDDLNYITCIF